VGFRWHKKGFWYAKQTPERFALVEGIQAIYNDTTEELETIQNEINSELEMIETNQPVEVETVQEETEETPANEIVNIEFTSDKKIKVSSIRFEWSESAEIKDGQTVSTFEEAEKLIKKAALNSPYDQGYDKTKFIIKWSDGQTYEGRIDIMKKDSFKITPLKEHVLSFINYVVSDKETGWYTEEEKEAYKHLLETYSLEDEKETPAPKNGKVLDFSSKFKAKQEKTEQEKAMNYFLNEILPYLSLEDKLKITEVSGNHEQFSNLMYDLMIKAKAIKLK
jgi:hypothetical protein